ncbi:50S ribosomal protein L7/L12, partial [Candidatus Peregrinibacteria bacterium]|nr:50S ribosomal protein L7/L12 [Candidatus Peregrinibacteria bacterium]
MSDEIVLPAHSQKILDEVKKLTVLELADLVKAMEKEFGVSAAAPVAAAGAAAGAAAEVKDTFNVELTAAGAQKINVIKVVR